MNCPNCGNAVVIGSLFCNKCGHKLASEVSQLSPVSDAAASDTFSSESADFVTLTSTDLYAEPGKGKGYGKQGESDAPTQACTLVITRTLAFTFMFYDFRVYLDDIEVGRISNGSSLTISIASGKHLLVLKLYWIGLVMQQSPVINLDCEPDSSIKFKCGADYWGGVTLLPPGRGIFIKPD